MVEYKLKVDQPRYKWKIMMMDYLIRKEDGGPWLARIDSLG